MHLSYKNGAEPKGRFLLLPAWRDRTLQAFFITDEVLNLRNVSRVSVLADKVMPSKVLFDTEPSETLQGRPMCCCSFSHHKKLLKQKQSEAVNQGKGLTAFAILHVRNSNI